MDTNLLDTKRCEICGTLFTLDSEGNKHCDCTDKEAIDSLPPSAPKIETVDVTKQAHYTAFEIQPVEYIIKNKLGYAEGHIIKYVTRHRLKGGVEDIKKAKHFCEMLIRQYETGEVKP